jgi:hypothetical protein
MAAVAPLEDLKAALESLETLKSRHPEAYAEIESILRTHRKVGYRNICRLLLGEATPEKLKGEG